ncbi:unnamed protein product (macronuclear) [Paramecium tetraurelia]|uniref:Uncharacterized protein n=1 Tax=Paramecium tetraurelia TaxID=5888 RepID=A0E391_PARTE|nr:uncharacterized protein GSPATT00022931001 [Paramecium tetraurelia]CAK89758.1 unnamed protein product [Paramecium tetraurelia]|eukprot:XP_001457155.1 hypothetical protein (macronuclear) [Paramecium tetraurelia strain d4-2]
MQSIKQLLMDVLDIIDKVLSFSFQDVVETYQQMNKSTTQEICGQSEIQQYEYILQIVAYLNRIKMLFEEQLNEHINNDYESIIQNLEASIRSHIRVEQQQKLQIEVLMQKLEEITLEKDLHIQQQQDKIRSLELIINVSIQLFQDQNKKLQENSPVEIIHKKSPSAFFERLGKFVQNKASKNTQNSTYETNLKTFLKACHTDADRSLSKGRRHLSAKREFGLQRINDETQPFPESKLTETERLRENGRHKLQRSDKSNELQHQTSEKQLQMNKYKAFTKVYQINILLQFDIQKQEQTVSSQSFEQVGKNLIALQKQISNGRLKNTQGTQLLKFLQKK